MPAVVADMSMSLDGFVADPHDGADRGGNHPLGVPVIVVTHGILDGCPRPDSTVSFATDGFFENLASAPVELDGPGVVEGNGVTRLTYRITRSDAAA